MRQPSDDRALYLRQLRATVTATFLPELTSPTAIDAAGLVDRILAELIVEEEWAEALSREFGAEFAALLPGPRRRDEPTARHAGALRRAPPPGGRGRGRAGRQRRCRRTGSAAGGSSTSSAASSSGSTSSAARVLDEQPEADAGTSSTECSLSREQLTDYSPPQAPGVARPGR